MTGSSPSTHKKRLMVLWGLSVLAFLLLAVSLADVTLEPGRRFRIPAPAGAAVSVEAPSWNGMLTILKVIPVALAVLATISLIVHLVSREGRRKLLADLVLIVILVLAASLLLRLRLPDTARKPEAAEEAGASMGQPVSLPTEPMPSFSADAPRWAGWATAAGLSLAAAAAGAAFLAALLRRRKRADGLVLKLAAMADAALESLSTGADARNVVVRCYAQMSGIVDRDRGIRRGADVTPGEFVKVLADFGIPEPPVRSLTRVFEEVRYGNTESAGAQERQALDALSQIAAACRGTRR
jgi:hypothetical protein